MLNFGKIRLQHNGKDINKHVSGETLSLATHEEPGPSFKSVYNEFGPTFPGEYIGEDRHDGIYCMSFKEGIAFLFPLKAPAGFSKIDFASAISVLSSSACQPAASMVVFPDKSWKAAREGIYATDLTHLLLAPFVASRRDGVPPEVLHAQVRDRGRIELARRDALPFILSLCETTQQDLLTELGPPDATYRKVLKKNTASHKRRTSSMSSRRSNVKLEGERNSSAISDTDGSDAWSDDDEEEETTVVNEFDNEDVGVWWNYYSHGLDILISQAHQASAKSPTAPRDYEADGDEKENEVIARNHLTATKVAIHSNIPGSYQFNRHRRLRWSLESWPLPHEEHAPPLTSETKFRDIQSHLHEVFRETYENGEEAKEQQQPLAINRDWGEASSLGNSVELLGGWEDSKKKGDQEGDGEGGRIGEVLVFGFPGLAFEVLKNGVVSCLQIW